jgi:Polysaccharide lyase
VTSPTRRGQYAARFQLNRDDPDVSASTRTEVSEALLAPRPPERNERWFGFSMFLLSDWVQDPLSPESVSQWHHVGATGPPLLGLITVDGQWQVRGPRSTTLPRSTSRTCADSSRQGNVATRGPLSQHWENFERHRRIGWYETGRWTDWVVHVRWSPDSDGLVEIWRDGEQVFSEPGKNKYSDGQAVYMKFGIYKWHWKSDPSKSITDVRVMHYDELRIADETGSYELVDPGAQPSEPRTILRPESDVVPMENNRSSYGLGRTRRRGNRTLSGRRHRLYLGRRARSRH